MEKGKGRGEKGSHMTEDITKNLTRKTGHGYCEIAEYGKGAPKILNYET
jgi:hypothetical protein